MSSRTALGIVVTSMAAVWAVVVGGLATWRHDEFLSHKFDLGNMVQVVWSTAQGRPLEATDALTGEQIVRLAAHAIRFSSSSRQRGGRTRALTR